MGSGIDATSEISARLTFTLRGKAGIIIMYYGMTSGDEWTEERPEQEKERKREGSKGDAAIDIGKKASRTGRID